jgi:hypothetical protein
VQGRGRLCKELRSCVQGCRWLLEQLVRPLHSSAEDIEHCAVFSQQQYMGLPDQMLFCISYLSVDLALQSKNKNICYIILYDGLCIYVYFFIFILSICLHMGQRCNLRSVLSYKVGKCSDGLGRCYQTRSEIHVVGIIKPVWRCTWMVAQINLTQSSTWRPRSKWICSYTYSD